MAVLFDTRAYHRTLTEAGVPADQADAHTRALESAMKDSVATRQDLELLSRDLKIWSGGLAAAVVAVILAAGKLVWDR